MSGALSRRGPGEEKGVTENPATKGQAEFDEDDLRGHKKDGTDERPRFEDTQYTYEIHRWGLSSFDELDESDERVIPSWLLKATKDASKDRLEEEYLELYTTVQQIDLLRESVSEIEKGHKQLDSNISEISDELDRLDIVENEHNEFEERVTALESTVSDMESAIETDQINLHTVDFIYRGVMVTGMITSIVAAIAFGLAYQLVTVTLLLLFIAAFFGWSYKRGLQPVNVW